MEPGLFPPIDWIYARFVFDFVSVILKEADLPGWLKDLVPQF